VWGVCLTVFVLGAAAQPAKAAFQVVTPGASSTGASIGDYLSVSVEQGDAAGTVRFVFKNTAPTSFGSARISEIYFDDTLAGLLALPMLLKQDYAGNVDVNFVTDAAGNGGQPQTNPGELPDGNTLASPFNTTDGGGLRFYSADSSPADAGLNSGETLGITFSLKNGATIASVMAAMNLAGINGGTGSTDTNLRIGLHVTGIPGDGSLAFIQTGTYGPPPPPPPANLPTPAPAGFVLLASALPFAFGLRRRLARRDVAA
jgi:hypothetical protein